MEIIPFELHLTVQPIPAEQENRFVGLCERLESKPILIELARGQHSQQPMLTKIFYHSDLPQTLSEARRLAEQLQAENFSPNRIKLEIPAFLCQRFADKIAQKPYYFEWHGKIEYKNPDILLQICQQHGAHLSNNSLKNQHNWRFITLRKYGDEQDFNQALELLRADLLGQDYPILKQQAEFCVYDSNEQLDAGWLHG